eukprot:gene10889-biopygen10915
MGTLRSHAPAAAGSLPLACNVEPGPVAGGAARPGASGVVREVLAVVTESSYVDSSCMMGSRLFCEHDAASETLFVLRKSSDDCSKACGWSPPMPRDEPTRWWCRDTVSDGWKLALGVACCDIGASWVAVLAEMSEFSCDRLSRRCRTSGAGPSVGCRRVELLRLVATVLPPSGATPVNDRVSNGWRSPLVTAQSGTSPRIPLVGSSFTAVDAMSEVLCSSSIVRISSSRRNGMVTMSMGCVTTADSSVAGDSRSMIGRDTFADWFCSSAYTDASIARIKLTANTFPKSVHRKK